MAEIEDRLDESAECSMKPAELRKRILEGEPLEDHELLVLLWGAGGGSGAEAIATRAQDLLEAAGGLQDWVDSTTPQVLRRRGVWGARGARMLAAVEIARRARADHRPRDLDAVALAALDLVAATLESVADDPSSREVALCAEMIRALERAAIGLGVRPQRLDGWFERLREGLEESE